MWPDFTNPWDHSIDRGLSDFHRKHRFVTSGLWQLPALAGQPSLAKAVAGGWSLAGVLTLQTGPYFMVRSGRDNSLSGQGYDRADLVGSIERPAGADPVRQWFNTAAFKQNAIGTFGNSGRNIVPGPGLAQVNFVVLEELPHLRAVQFAVPRGVLQPDQPYELHLEAH